MIRNTFILFALGLPLIVSGCTSSPSGNTEAPVLFERMPASYTGIHFANELTYTNELNPYTYRNFFNGGGVGLGDFDRDGLTDIFFTGNQVGNRLYLNLGNFRFMDITDEAGLSSKEVWSTGISVVDVNGDDWLDIYVCKSGSPDVPNRHNQLFINNGDLTFTDQSGKYGLDVIGLSTDASFFDYDRDGDLDMYLLNNSFTTVSEASIQSSSRTRPDPEGGGRLFRNELISRDQSSASFTDVTGPAGIYSSAIGFGLDILAGDINKDGWTDIYITNDYFERDYLYLNNQDGTFTEQLTDAIKSISLSSMGGDLADLTHDGRPEIYITDMLPERMARQKVATAFDFWDDYQNRIDKGYHYQFVRNTLQLNQGTLSEIFRKRGKIQPVYFSEIGRLANVYATDWSWSALLADLDQDGNNDIYVTNGIYRDLTYQDYVTDHRSLNKLRSVVEEGKPIYILFDDIPSTPVSNYAFSFSDKLTYKNKATAWGLAKPGFSNGAAYGDLDNDGDLDLVVSNINEQAYVYRNRADMLKPHQNWLKIKLEGNSLNTSAIGAQATIWSDSITIYREQMPNRGFQSSVDHRLHFGLGHIRNIDSLQVVWPGGGTSVLRNPDVNQQITIKQPDEVQRPAKSISAVKQVPEITPGHLIDITDRVELNYVHKENDFVDFERERLLFHMRSAGGPAACAADVNGDGLDDLYLGGAKGQAGAIYIQQSGLKFQKTGSGSLASDRQSEDTGCIWFDADGDEDMDLYVTSGGSEFPASSGAIADRLYLNDGKGIWKKADRALPADFVSPASVVDTADFDQDGDLDLFVGSRLKAFAYGIPVDGALLENNGSGVFTNSTEDRGPGLLKTGLITDARWADYDRDGDMDLIVVGEWMPVRVFRNSLAESGYADFEEVTVALGLKNTNGWWQSVEIRDLNRDGYLDIIAGNHGQNSMLSASRTLPLYMFAGDFDENGIIEQIIAAKNNIAAVPLVLRQDLLEQLPSMQQKFPTFESYSQATIEDILTSSQREDALRLEIYELRNAIFWNREGQQFEKRALPVEAQFAPVYGILADTINSVANRIYLGGNLYGVKPQIGRYDASYGTTVDIEPSKKITVLSHQISGFAVEGEIRSILKLKSEDGGLYLVIRNDDHPVWFIQR